MNCNHWKDFIFILPFYEWFPVLHVGWLVTVQVRVLEFLFKERLWKKKIIVVHVNGTRHTKAFAVMVTVNIAQILDVLMIAVNVGKKLKMKIMGKEINDECSKCGKILECELFRQGHGIKQERENIAKMIKCQMKHREEREKND